MRHAVVQLAPFTEQRRKQPPKEQVKYQETRVGYEFLSFGTSSAHTLAHAVRGAHIYPLYMSTPTKPCH